MKELVDLLEAHDIRHVVDVRTVPKSRHNPQFNEKRVGHSLKAHSITYQRLEKLGGFRHTTKQSINRGWRNLSFRGFADYMGTENFTDGLAQLESIAGKRRTAIMCAEALPWRCHRSLIADALTKDKWTVYDIMNRTKVSKHQLTSFLKMRRGLLTYPAYE
jgi:uncharacterized protein (DUF488 family)